MVATMATATSPVSRARTLVLAYAVVSVLWFSVNGLPTERLFILVWLFGLLALSIAGDRQRSVLSLLRDWGAFAVLLVAYRYSAGLADSVGRPVIVEPLVDLDRAIGFGEVPTVRLQEWLGIGPGSDAVPWWHVPLSLVYLSHFFAVLVAAAWLWRTDRRAWIGYSGRLLSLGMLAVATYVILPAAPPWMAADQQLIAPVARTSLDGLQLIGLGLADPIVEQGRAVANPVAALPSMHAGFAAFLLAYFWGRTASLGRVALVTYAATMAFTLVATGEHWVVDVVLGWLYVGLVMTAWQRVEQHRAGRRAVTATVSPWPDPASQSSSSASSPVCSSPSSSAAF
jgi:hypothetical protein